MWGKHCSFPHKILWIATVSLHMVFFLIIFSKLSLSIYFFNIELFENYNYKSLQIRLNHVGKHCSFHHKTLWIDTIFPHMIFFQFLLCFLFFIIFFSKIIFVDIIFLILSWLEFNFVIKLNHMGKAL